MRTRLLNLAAKTLSALLCLEVLAAASSAQTLQLSETGSPITLRLQTWQAEIDPARLTVRARLPGSGRELLIADGDGQSRQAHSLAKLKDSARWTIPQLELKVEVTAIDNRLHFRFEAGRELTLTWPVAGRDPAMSTLIYPDGEGLYIPLDDAFWQKSLSANPCRDTHGMLSMPFWSYQWSGGTITYLALSDLETQLCVSSRSGRLSNRAIHDFSRRDGLRPYEVEIWPGGASAISPALEYRQWLIGHGQYVTLAQKAAKNPEVAKLLGAVHAYVFGDGRATTLLDELDRLGVDRMWLGYDQDPRAGTYLVGEPYIREAERLGYLVGPYDTFDNIQDSRSADSVSSIWGPDLYQAGCIVKADGRIRAGFAGRGCELSSQALALAEPTKHYIERRVDGHARTGINSYFLDNDAFGELYDDYSRAHPMTLRQDRLNRLERLRYIGATHKLVLGSEGGAGWSAPVIDFAHGTEAVSSDLLWTLQKDRQRYGGWWPPARPSIFFRRLTIGASEFRTARYDPVYRLPLYQAVFHGSVVTTDRWETPLLKFTDLVQTRTLLELLYNVPSMWSLDLNELRQNREFFAALYRFFSPIHRRIGDKPLTGFRWLTPDRKVQQTEFGNEIRLIANFGLTPYQSIPSMCIEAEWLSEHRTKTFCPKP